MPQREPNEIDQREARRRRQRVGRLARSLGFHGRVEYRHVYSQSGGAQYCVGTDSTTDVMIVYAEAFDRDDDPQDFSLRAIVAHECGHQRLLREPELKTFGRRLSGTVYEEVLASLIGSLLVDDEDAEQLVWKATIDLAKTTLPADQIVLTIEELRSLLKEIV